MGHIKGIKFETIEEYKKYLKCLIKMLGEEREYNFFVHQINNYYDYRYLNYKHPEKVKVSQIIKNGLDLDKYSAVCGTTRMLGSTENINVDNIINYEYYDNMQNRFVCLFALPKYIEVYVGKDVEFSSYNDYCGYKNKDLIQAYLKHNIRPDSHHFKSSLFDVIKDFSMPKCFLLGVQWLQNDKDDCLFLMHERHISFLEEEKKDMIYDDIREKILQQYQIYGTENTEELIIESFKKEQVWRDEQLSFEI